MIVRRPLVIALAILVPAARTRSYLLYSVVVTPLILLVLDLGRPIALGLLSDSAYALLASYLGVRWRGRRSSLRLGERLSGLVYVGLGVLAAVTRRPARS